MSCDVYHGSTITIAGLVGPSNGDEVTQTADDAALALTVDKADLLAATGVWTQTTGTLVMTVATASQADYFSGHWETGTPAEGTVVVSFKLRQANSDDTVGASPTITLDRHFAPNQYGPGTTQAPWWGSATKVSASESMTKPDAAIFGVANGVNPLVHVIPALDVATVTQTSPFIDYDNVITVSFSCNVDLTNSDVAKIKVETLTGSGISADHAWTEVSGFSGNNMGTGLAVYATDSLEWTVATSLSSAETYVWSFAITNPIAAQAPTVSITVATTKTNNDAATADQAIAITHADPLPDTALKGVTNGINALKIVVPFEVRTFDDTVDTPGAPNIVTVAFTTNIAFVANDEITITGLLLETGSSASANVGTITSVTNSATDVFGTGAAWDQTTGHLVFTCVGTAVEATAYSFKFTVTNPPSTFGAAPSLSLTVATGFTTGSNTVSPGGVVSTPFGIQALAMTQSAANTGSGEAVTVPFTIIDPAFASLVFTTAEAPGAASELVITFTPGDEVSTSKTNLGVVTIILPGFTGGTDAGITGAVTSAPDTFDTMSFTRFGSSSILQLTTSTNTAAFDAEVVVTVPIDRGIKLPADGVTANQASVKLSIGPGVWSEEFSVTTMAAVTPLITGVRINALAAKGAASSSTVATMPRFSTVLIGLEERADVTATIFQDADEVSLRQGSAAWGCYATRAGASSTSRTADIPLTLIGGASPISHNGTFDASTIEAATANGTTYTMCFVGADILGAGVDSETAITVELQSKVTSVELNSNGNQFSYLKQSPRNDFSVKLAGDAIADGNTVAFIPDASACPTDMNTANSVTFTGAATVSSGVASFVWAGCIPTTSGVPLVMDSPNCPTEGLYRLCYNNGGDSDKIETGISTYFFQAHTIELTSAAHVSSPTFDGTAATNATLFGADFVYEVFEPFTVTVLLKDGNGNPCCEGTKVFLALTKAGVDDSSNLYNSGGSNANANKIVLADANGVAVFTSYTIRGTAGKFFYLTASVAGATLNIPATGAADAGFMIRPTKLSQFTTLNTEYIVAAGGDNANADLGDIEIRALDRYDNVLAGLVTADDCHCEAMLETGSAGTDSAQATDFGGVGGFTSSSDLTAATVVFNEGKATFSAVKVAKTAGRYFRLKYWMTEHAGSTGAAVLQTLGYTTSDAAAVNSPTSYTQEAYSTLFMLSAAKMKLTYGGTASDSPHQHATATEYTSSTFPIVTRLDGAPATYPVVDAPNTDGLPSSINVVLLDGNGDTLSSTNCTGCFFARLVKCDDSTPTNGTTTGMGLTNGDGVTLPACVGQAIDADEPDQMAGMTQALCATNGGECTASTDFQQTLSSSGATAQGTTAFVANGIAAFYGLQARYTFGAGFLLRFVMDPQYDNISYANETVVTPVNGSVNHTDIKTVHTAANGQVFFPDIGSVGGGHVTSDHKSMIIRPWGLEVAQHPGGDGVDLDGLTPPVVADGTVNTPDGVGAGQPFRVQPAVVVKGHDGSSEYYFSKAWANHGHMPITAVIKSETCGQDCVDKGIVLTGTNDTGVSLTALTAAAHLNDGSGDLTAIYSGDPSSIDVEMTYQTILSGNVGFWWKDLRVLTRDSDTGYESLKLMFMAGWHTHLLQEYVNNSAGTFTAVDSGFFDVFTAPGAPLNLQASAYGELGFRIEYDPSDIARLKPLSGFIVEIDFCSQSGASSGSCALRDVAGYSGALSVAPKPLGSDLYTGGGRAEEVQFGYSPTVGGEATEVNITLRPKDHIYGGDELRIHLNYPGLYRAVDYSGTCTPEGTHGALFTADINANTSVLTLTAIEGAVIARGSPVLVKLPLGCEIIYPDNALAFEAANAHLGSNHTKTNLADYQSSRWGTKVLTPPARAIAYVVGSPSGSSGDNCKNVTCTVSSTKVLPIVQDSNTMDLTWSGSLQYGAVGVACATTIGVPEDTSSQTFPSRRFCSMASTGSNDLDAYDHVAANPSNIYVTSNFGNSGQNGKPIGSNAGRAGRPGGVLAAEVTQSSGTLFVDSSSLCRAGGSTRNPCMLPSGEEWNPAVSLAYNFTGGNVTSMTVNLRRDERCIYAGTSFTVPIPSGVNAEGSVSPLGCDVADGAGSSLSGWVCHWVETSSEGSLVIYAGSTVCPPDAGPAAAVVTTTGTLAVTSTAGFPGRAVALSNNNAGHSTLVVRNGASLASYTTLSGDPVGNYAASGSTLAIAANDIVSIRAYAFNGRFRSPAAETPVQTRAILKPTAPAYFSTAAQRSVGVVLTYSQTNASMPTQITIDVTAPADLLNGTSLNVPLAGLTSAVSPVRDIATGHAVFTVAQWNANTSTLNLIVAPGTQANQAQHYTIEIPSSAGILYPAQGTPPGAVIAMIATYSINWVSPFPIVSRPRKGFVVQATTDRNWNSDISTVLFPDKLNQGPSDAAKVGYIQADVAAGDLNITVKDPGTGPTYDWLTGKYILVGQEVMKVTSVTGGALSVLRGQINTGDATHTQVTGGGTCACDADGVSTGTGTNGQSCGCTSVSSYYVSATDASIGRYDGFDLNVGTAGNNPPAGSDGCRIGAIYWPLGCNIRVPPVAYSAGIRAFQSAILQTGQPKLNWLTNCGTAGSTCTGVCDCTTPTLLPNTDLGAPTLAEDPLYIRNLGDPLQWSNTPATTLGLAISSTTVQNVILDDASAVAASYMRIGDELVYVHGARARGVKAVSLYQVSGNSADGTPCVCDVLGNATGGGTCGCYPTSHMYGCTAGGTLQSIGGGGLGFRATFTVADPGPNGYIDSIVINDPGYGYIAIPDIRIASGGDGCTLQAGQSFIAVTSNTAVKVERGALGTTAVTHAAGVYVSVVQWPLRGTRNSPGAQYYFRIAAYNDAGLSDYLYYKHQITEMSPRQLPTTGGQTIEVTLEGGGHQVGNTTVYIGHTHLNGTLDLARSKPCASLVVSDIAGTRLTCVTPPWVGRSHDLLVTYNSGSIYKLSVADNYVSFPAPTVKLIEPVQVTAGTAVIITVTGTSFGNNNTDVIGALITSNGENPCSPLQLVSDTSALCHLQPKTGQQLDGNIIIGVGTPWSGGQQNSTTSLGLESKLKEFDPPAEVELTVAKNIDEIPEGSPARAQFETSFKGDIAKAAGVPEFRVNITAIRPGSVVVVFVILPDPNSIVTSTPAQVAAVIAQQAADPTSALLTGSVTSGVTGVSVAASVLESAAQATGTIISTTTQPNYFTASEPKDYTLPNMERCLSRCRRLCETGNEVPSIDGYPVLAIERPRVCKTQCMSHCGFGRPIVRQVFA